MKMAPIIDEMAKKPREFEQILIHTGQHYDGNMSQVFFDELGLPRPDVNLEVGSASHAAQTAQIMQRFEPVLLEWRPDWVIVPGDVNSTMACTLVASKLGFRVAHVEAGLRSFDRTMPEEINRLVTDQLADLLFTPSRDGNENLQHEGVPAEKITFVGNVMIDTLVRLLPIAEERWPGLRDLLGLDRFMLVTLHRPSNVDSLETLNEIVQALKEIGRQIPVVFPVHPRTRGRFAAEGLSLQGDNLLLIEPLGYLDFLALETHAGLVLTDSGGVQEETTYLGVPCLTARPNTERPVTLTQGTNILVKSTKDDLLRAFERALGKAPAPLDDGPQRPEFWDGKSAQRIVQKLLEVDK
jgi:UDP-N-acetylglucosamine 2-epimerase (non-hydrolysing)